MMENKKEKNASGESYSIHTFELKLPLEKKSVEDNRVILNTKFRYNPSRSHWRNSYYYEEVNKRRVAPVLLRKFYCYDNDELFDRGLSYFTLTEKVLVNGGYQSELSSGSITFQVNPRILLGHKDNPYICIVPSDELRYIILALVETLLPYGFSESDIRLAVINRLDICANVQMDSQEQAKAYLSRLRKGGYFQGLNFKPMVFSETGHRYVYPQNEVKYTGRNRDAWRKRQEMSIYLKQEQMKECRHEYDSGEVERACGQIRFELRFFRKKAYYLEGKYDCEESSDLLGLASFIGDEELTRYLYGLYGKGKILKRKEAFHIIAQSKHQVCVRNVMKKIIEVTEKEDMAVAFEGLKSKKWRYMQYFNDLNISPITIPESWAVEEFENPVTYIETRNVNERDLN